jgi:hypothetical protein
LFSTYSPILSYEVTDQNSEGVFSSLSRDFDKTIEEISNNDNREEAGNQDTPTSTSTNTQNSNERILNSTSTPDTTSSNNDVSNTTTTTTS